MDTEWPEVQTMWVERGLDELKVRVMRNNYVVDGVRFVIVWNAQFNMKYAIPFTDWHNAMRRLHPRE